MVDIADDELASGSLRSDVGGPHPDSAASFYDTPKSEGLCSSTNHP